METRIYGDVFNIQRFSTRDGPGIRTTVFLKGCPLRCYWCQNPESQSRLPALLFNRSMCTGCGDCTGVCSNGANSQTGTGRMDLDRELCVACGACVEVCPAHCRVLAGRKMSVEEVMAEVRKDRAAYTNSGGGVTISGGEPLGQPVFLTALLKAARDEAIHTAIETSGFAPWGMLKTILTYVDYVMFDLKCMDSERHCTGTGVENTQILENARKTVSQGKQVLFRVPLIPEFNDDEGNIRATARFVKYELGLDSEHLELLKYNKMGEAKYGRMGCKGPIPNMHTQSKEQLAALEQIVKETYEEERQ